MINDIQPDIVIPLDSVYGSIWDNGWRGEIWYLPIEDYDILPDDVALMWVDKITTALQEGKTIAMFCIAGHGRTGYMASMVMSAMGVDDPITMLREEYCSKCLETKEQVQHVARLMGKPELEKHIPKLAYGFSMDGYSDPYSAWWIDRLNKQISGTQVPAKTAEYIPDDEEVDTPDEAYDKLIREGKTCKSCEHYNTRHGECSVYRTKVSPQEIACSVFVDWYEKHGIAKWDK